MARDCFAKIDLVSVFYSRDNIGNDWDFRITFTPPGAAVVIAPHKLDHNTTKVYNTNIVNRIIGPCDPGALFQVQIVAREDDGFFGVDDIATHFTATPRYECPEEPLATQFFTQFAVTEKRPWFLRWLPPRVGLLEYTFDIELQCIEL